MNEEKRDRDAALVYRDARFALGRKDGEPCLTADGKTYALSCHPYEPCTYVRDGGALRCAIHNAFDPAAVLKAFAKGETVRSITGKEYDPRTLCETLLFAAEHCFDTDLAYVEGAMAVERLKALGATGPETAVALPSLGVQRISERFSHSKKRPERVMYTEDGRVYVRIKK